MLLLLLSLYFPFGLKGMNLGLLVSVPRHCFIFLTGQIDKLFDVTRSLTIILTYFRLV